MGSTFLTGEWRKLVIVNYAIDQTLLEPYLPYKTEFDFWQNKCYVSLLAFRFLNTTVKGIPVPFHRDFEEINLRFYVRHKDGSAWKRGVTFLKEIVRKPALMLAANLLYNENYITLPTTHSWTTHEDEIRVSYEWKHKGKWDSLSATAAAAPIDLQLATEEEFITEHYWGYTKVNDHETLEYPVEHDRWQVYAVKSHEIRVRFGDLYGPAFNILDKTTPASVMLAEGSGIKVGTTSTIR
jgi:uncharacterized protein YqjF (DUF2071 family)